MAAHMRGKQAGKKYRKFDKNKQRFRQGPRLKKWQLELEETKKLQERYENINTSEISSFEDLPLSSKTRIGLSIGQFKAPTEIQRNSISLALQGHDVLGAAKTGSGKTLAFLVPVLECLFRNRWNAEDGLGALIISPTRELAYQTFEVLCKIGKKHDFSAGLIIGGKDLQTEVERIARTNIVVCTPGRLLQHMDMTPDFECTNLQMLVLDEADRILDLGFEKTMNAIIENLPPERQTLLFSATQTKSVRDLARLSLKDPKYVSVHQHHEYSTPAQLEQSYVVCDLDQKADLLYSFIRNHRDKKILVFMASCKQVKYMFEAFCKLGAGTTIMALYGTLHQLRRVAIYNEFCKKDSAVLFATDIAARGLDFPAVNWVVQLDCPEDANTYIHRAGRTARYEKGGESLLVLLPSEEEEMVKLLEEKKIPIEQIRVNPNKKMTIQRKLESFCAENLEFKQTAQRCFIAYIKSVYLMKNKKVFDVHKMELDKFALSLGLAVPPRVRFLQREEKRKQLQQQKKQQKEQQKLTSKSDPGDESNVSGKSLQTSAATSEGISVKPDSIDEEENESEDGSESEEDVDGFRQSLLNVLGDGVGQSANKSSPRTSNSKDTKKNVLEKRTSLKPNPESDSGQSSAGSSSEEDGSDDDEDMAEKESKLAGFHGNSDGEDDDGDLFTVKADVFGLKDKSKAIIDSDEEFLQVDHKIQQKKEEKDESRKPANKIQHAKKLQKKKLAVNTKMVFGDEGEAVQQWPPRQKTVTKTDEDEEDEYEGGINIDKAREFMSEEDKHDKVAFRQRVKEKHKAKRLKEKEKRQRNRREESDPGVTLDFQDEDTFDPDTLPDPSSWSDDDDDANSDEKPDDKSGISDGEAGNEGVEEQQISRSGKKLKRKHTDNNVTSERKDSTKKKKKTKEKKVEQLGVEMTLAEQEELALHILGNR